MILDVDRVGPDPQEDGRIAMVSVAITDSEVETPPELTHLYSLPEEPDPIVDESYWREHHHEQSFMATEEGFERYVAAYRTGWEGAQKYGANLHPDELASRLEQDYVRVCDRNSVGWEQGRPAALAAYNRAHAQVSLMLLVW